MTHPFILFIFSYWFYYLIRISASYFDYYLSMTVFNMVLVVLGIVYIFVSALLNRGEVVVNNRNKIIVFLAISVLLAFIPAVLSSAEFFDNEMTVFGVYFVAVFPVLFLMLGLLISGRSSLEYFVVVQKLYIILFFVNFFVGMFQIIGVENGFLSLDLFFNNKLLNAVIFPGFGMGDDRLRMPGLFANGGVNAYFNSLGLVFILSKVGLNKISLIEKLMIVISIYSIYLTLTRKVWFAIILTLGVLMLLNIFYSSSKSQKIKNTWFLFFSVLLSIPSVIYMLDKINKSQAFNSHSIEERIYEWGYYLTLFESASLYEFSFGFGVLQAFFGIASSDKFILVDNVFIAVFLYSGFLGLIVYSILWLTIGYILFVKFINAYKKGCCEPLIKFSVLIWFLFSIVSLFSTFFADISTVMFAVTVFLLALVENRKYVK